MPPKKKPSQLNPHLVLTFNTSRYGNNNKFVRSIYVEMFYIKRLLCVDFYFSVFILYSGRSGIYIRIVKGLKFCVGKFQMKTTLFILFLTVRMES